MNFSTFLKGLVFLVGLLSSICLSTNVFAETVSVLMTSNKSEDYHMEAALKRHLRAEGYTVKGGTTDGYLLQVSVMPSITVSGFKSGVTGHLTVSSLTWQNMGDSLVSDKCKAETEAINSFNSLVGTRIIYINAYMATAADEEQLAEMMSTFANRQIRATSKKVTEFFSEWNAKYNREVLSTPIEQTR